MNSVARRPLSEFATQPNIETLSNALARETAAIKDWCLARADEWYARGDFGPACDFLQHATEVDPKDARVWIALGSLRYELRQFELSAGAFVEAGRLEPLKARAFMHLALTHEQLGHIEHTETLFRHAVMLEPENALAKSLLDGFLKNKGRHAGAQPGLEASNTPALET